LKEGVVSNGIEIVKLTPEEWGNISAETMKYAFAEIGWTKEMNRVSYAIIVQDVVDKIPLGFGTIVELDKDTAYIQHGGAFPTARGSACSGRGYFKLIEYLRHRYASVQMRVKNINFQMLRLNLKMGFVTTGIQTDKFGVCYLFQELADTYGLE
jgi:hypothetical protein